MSTKPIIDLTGDNRPKTFAPKLSKSTTLEGKTFVLTGVWIIMSAEQAKALCIANGGRVVATAMSNADYIVVGARGTRQDTSSFTDQGAKLLSEKDFMNLILEPSQPNKENQSRGVSQKRPAEEPVAGPSKPSKAARKSDPGPGATPDGSERAMKRVHDFLCGGEIRMKGKSLTAYDCGGQVYKAQRGKSAVDLLIKFGDWLEKSDGEYHHLL